MKFQGLFKAVELPHTWKKKPLGNEIDIEALINQNKLADKTIAMDRKDMKMTQLNAEIM